MGPAGRGGREEGGGVVGPAWVGSFISEILLCGLPGLG